MRIDLFFREHSPWMSRQETKDIKLIFRKAQVLLSYPYVSALQADMQLSAANLRICIFRLPLQHKNLQLFPLFSCKYILEDLSNLYPRRIFLYVFPILPVLSSRRKVLYNLITLWQKSTQAPPSDVFEICTVPPICSASFSTI